MSHNLSTFVLIFVFKMDIFFYSYVCNIDYKRKEKGNINVGICFLNFVTIKYIIM